MRYLKLRLCALSAVVLATVATAQSRPGVAYDQTIRTVTSTPDGRIDSSTNVLHLTAAGGDARIEFLQGRAAKSIGPFSPGPHSVIIMRDGGNEMTFINPDEKQYLSMKPFEMMEGVQKRMRSMGGSMVIDTSVTKVSLDSIGVGPVIDGHPTLTYRLKLAIKMTVSMMGQQNVVETRSTQDIQNATDMGSLSDMAAAFTRYADFTRSMGLGKDFTDKVTATQSKMRGLPLRAVKHTTSSANGITQTSDETLDTRNVKRMTVPDSLFTIPAGYKSVSMPAMPDRGVPF